MKSDGKKKKPAKPKKTKPAKVKAVRPPSNHDPLDGVKLGLSFVLINIFVSAAYLTVSRFGMLPYCRVAESAACSAQTLLVVEASLGLVLLTAIIVAISIATSSTAAEAPAEAPAL